MLDRDIITGSCGIMRVDCSQTVKDEAGRNRQVESIVEDSKEEKESFKDILEQERKHMSFSEKKKIAESIISY